MMGLSEAAAIVGSTLVGQDAMFDGVSTDSRKINQGDLFVAIPGDKYDGHDFVPGAAANQAAGVLVSRPVETKLPRIEVEDTTRSLGVIAANWRARFDLPVAAITGSNGKTTVTAMVDAILGESGNCLAPEGSFNNQWGVPLTLLKLSEAHDYAVIEMGMNHPGEIQYLSALTRPTVALINNAAPAHLEGMGDLESIAREKSAIFSGLAWDGTAVINADDRFCDQWKRTACENNLDRRAITFGIDNPAEIRAAGLSSAGLSSEFDLCIANASTRVTLPLAGAHNVMNALAAAAVCTAMGVSLEAVGKGLCGVSPVRGRLVKKQGLNDSIILDDSYNANPQSIRAGIDVLEGFGGIRILVLGVMAELGEAADELHRDTGSYARKKGIEHLYCLAGGDGSRARMYARGYGAGAKIFDNVDDLITDLGLLLGADHTVLVKGSRSSRMERVVEGIVMSTPVSPGEAAAC